MNLPRHGVHPVVMGQLKSRVAPKAVAAKPIARMKMKSATKPMAGDLEMFDPKPMKVNKLKKGKKGAKKFDPMYGC